uniref:Putative secreted protein n=1 Tax=Anopheles marajoara TaxID=58244 RepID=A0A2M4C5E2_9DIPT
MSVLLLLLLPLLLGVMSRMGSVGQVAAFPVPTEVTTYSSIADLGSLAQGAAGIANQVWSTGSRLGSEFLRRGFAFLGVA